MNKVLIFIMLTSTVFYSSCTKKINTGKSQNVSSQPILIHPMKSDLKVSESQVVGISEGKIIDEKIVIENAIASALKQVNADVLIEPIFEVERDHKNIYVEVRGYPAYHTNFQKLTTADTSLMYSALKIYRSTQPAIPTVVNTSTAPQARALEETPVEKKKGFRISKGLYAIGIGNGINATPGRFGISSDLRLFRNLYYKTGLGSTSWGNGIKSTLGFHYNVKPYSFLGSSFYATISNFGSKSATVDVPSEVYIRNLKVGTSNQTDIYFEDVSTLNLGGSYGLKLGRAGIIYFEYGYAFRLNGGYQVVQDNYYTNYTTVLTSDAVKELDKLKPGGLILGFGLKLRIY